MMLLTLSSMEQLSSLSLTFFLLCELHQLPVLLVSFLISPYFYMAVFFLSCLLCLFLSQYQFLGFFLFCFVLKPLSLFWLPSSCFSVTGPLHFLSEFNQVNSEQSPQETLSISGNSCFLDTKPKSFL